MEDGQRRVVSISEITGMEGDVIITQDIFRFRRRGHSPEGVIQGDFETTGVRPKVMDMLAARGLELPPLMFSPGRRSL